MLFTPSTYLSSNCAREYLYIVVAFSTNSISTRTNYKSFRVGIKTWKFRQDVVGND